MDSLTPFRTRKSRFDPLPPNKLKAMTLPSKTVKINGKLHTADRILKETIREALDTLSQDAFVRWIRGFVS